MTVILSGFADEISPDPQAQLATLAAESIWHLELRSAWSVNVADFTGEQVAGLILAHENEKGIYGDVPDRCADLITAVGSPALRATFDPANFVQCGVRPFSEAYALIRPHLVYLQVKDALAATGEVVPAGQGDGELRETLAALRDSGFAGFMSLEPHLAQAGRFGGFSGPEGFVRAASALKFLLNEASIPWQ